MSPISRALALIALIIVAAVPFTPAVEWLASTFAVPSQLERADAIVVLGAGLQNERDLTEHSLRRMVTGVGLYRRGLAPVLMFSGGAGEAAAAEADVMATAARDIGVPAAHILVETASTNTWSQGMEVARALRPDGRRRILLVTDPFHMRRARAVFERAGFDVLAAPAHPWVRAHQSPEGNLVLMRRIGQEAVGWAYYRARGWL